MQIYTNVDVDIHKCRYTQILKDLQRSTKIYKDLQRSTKLDMIYTNVDVDIHKCRYTQMWIYINVDRGGGGGGVWSIYTQKCRYDIHKCR